jgi:hypothetical protein
MRVYSWKITLSYYNAVNVSPSMYTRRVLMAIDRYTSSFNGLDFFWPSQDLPPLYLSAVSFFYRFSYVLFGRRIPAAVVFGLHNIIDG